ncbi:FtsK/SpoIIIE domain-containing protein [Agromyces arachidis]|uniref:FtsK/SpoIIIE domain-containing protein n=1 Tax=Agromyces arachidis TaxID=766966 RepID=UPI0040563AB5
MHPSSPRPSVGVIPLTLPPPAPEPRRAGFPWIASAAPVAGALVVWAVTGSLLAIAFAVLGPLVAVASMLDSRRQSARERRRSAARREDALRRLESEVAERHAAERDRAWLDAPGARGVVRQEAPGWLAREPGEVVVGVAVVPSTVRIDGVPSDDADAGLLRRAARLTGAPFTVPVAGGIGFVGPRPLALAAARAAVLQCAHLVPPDALSIEGPPTPEWAWLESLPHAAPRAPAVLTVVDSGAPGGRPGRGDRAHVIALGEAVADLPPGLATLVRLRHRGSAVVGGDSPTTVVPELSGAAEAAAWARRTAVAASRAGLAAGSALPQRVALSDVPAPQDHRSGRAGLRVAVGAADDGPLELDLVTGPHALVAGTSGSGKSEFLTAWITALAVAHPPDLVAFLLVDFKGGAAFEPVRRLPHVTGVVTDLAEAEAGRAVLSIRAELRYRERVIADAGVRDLAGLPAEVVLPRLVVVVDEFQAMVERFPELGAVIADVAARGRSLGVHLVLASQRPNGVVRESVTANCGIRVSLRVLDRADSLAVVGSADAAELDAAIPGRAVADRGDGRVVRFQSAMADETAIGRALERHRGVPVPRRTWLDPLPSSIELGTIADVLGGDPGPTGLLLGVADDPERQRRVAARWEPAVDGPLVAVGMAGSGRTALLDAVAAQVAATEGPDAVLRMEGPASRAWDALTQLADAITSGRGDLPRLLVVDDVDTRLATWPEDARLHAMDRLATVLQGARARGLAVIASATRTMGLPAGVRDGLTAVVLLRHPSRADLVQAGGDGRLWDAESRSGSGQWRGLRAQFLAAPRPSPVLIPPPPRFTPSTRSPTAICSSAPRTDAAAVRRAVPDAEVVVLGEADSAARAAAMLGEAPSDGVRVVIGDADAWAANWSLASEARSRAVVVVHGGVREYRALVRGGGPPPLLDDAAGQCWEVPAEGLPDRRVWVAADNGIRASSASKSTDSVRSDARN